MNSMGLPLYSKQPYCIKIARQVHKDPSAPASSLGIVKGLPSEHDNSWENHCQFLMEKLFPILMALKSSKRALLQRT